MKEPDRGLETRQVNQLHFNQIKSFLEGHIKPHIDLTNLGRTSEADRAQHALSRCLAALTLMDKAGLSAQESCGFVTDGAADDGIDAIYFDEKSTTLYIIQAKFLNDPNKGVSEDAFTKPRDGFQRLIELKFGKRNADLKRAQNLIKFALQSTELKCKLIISSTSQQPFGLGLKEAIEAFCLEQNSLMEDFFNVEHFDIKSIHEAIRRAGRAQRYDTSIMLFEWGHLKEPHYVVYGQASGRSIVKWYEDIGVRLFADNLRYGLGSSETNRGIARTVAQEPQNFLYFNNGITIVAESVDKTALNGMRRESGVFELKKISVINGAQTVTSLHAALKASKADTDPLVFVKIVSLEGSRPDFAQRITRFNNTQNRIDSIDFVSQDHNQERIKNEAQALGLKYAYRSGEPDPNALNGFHFRQAAIAAACSSGRLDYAVVSKRYVSGLWENTQSTPYTDLFNSSVTAKDLWLRVRVDREIESELTRFTKKLVDDVSSNSKSLALVEAKVKALNLTATHSIRFVSFCVFNALRHQGATWTYEEIEAACSLARRLTRSLLVALIQILDGPKGKGYLGNLFKNKERQAAILEDLPQRFHPPK